MNPRLHVTFEMCACVDRRGIMRYIAVNHETVALIMMLNQIYTARYGNRVSWEKNLLLVSSKLLESRLYFNNVLGWLLSLV